MNIIIVFSMKTLLQQIMAPDDQDESRGDLPAPESLDDNGPHCQVRDKMPIHDIDVNLSGAGILYNLYLLSQAGEIS